MGLCLWRQLYEGVWARDFGSRFSFGVSEVTNEATTIISAFDFFGVDL